MCSPRRQLLHSSGCVVRSCNSGYLRSSPSSLVADRPARPSDPGALAFAIVFLHISLGCHGSFGRLSESSKMEAFYHHVCRYGPQPHCAETSSLFLEPNRLDYRGSAHGLRSFLHTPPISSMPAVAGDVTSTGLGSRLICGIIPGSGTDW